MPSPTTAPVSDMFVSLDISAQTDFANWAELLREEKRHKGLTRITVECFAGRAGFKEIGEIICADTDGQKIENPGDVADLKPQTVAASAYQLARRDHKRDARGRYRLQLWYVKKKGNPPVRGDYATLIFDADGNPGSGYDGGGDPNYGVYKLLKEENRELRVMLKDVLGSQVEMAQGNAATMLNALKLGEVAQQHRAEVAEQSAKLETRASPEDWNRRWETATRNLAGPISQGISLLGQYLPNAAAGGPMPAGGPPPPPPSPDGGQAAAQKFFEGLSSEQKDQLRDQLPGGCFQAVVEVIAGDNQDWHREKRDLVGILRGNALVLMKILTKEQMAELMQAVA